MSSSVIALPPTILLSVFLTLVLLTVFRIWPLFSKRTVLLLLLGHVEEVQVQVQMKNVASQMGLMELAGSGQ